MYKQIMKILDGNKKLFLLQILLAVSASLFIALKPIVIQITTDSILGDVPMDAPNFIEKIYSLVDQSNVLSLLLISGFLYIMFVAFESLFTFGKGYVSGHLSENIAKKLKNELYDHIQHLPYEYHKSAKTGDLIQRATADVDLVRNFFSNTLPEMVKITFFSSFMILILFSLNPTLAFFSIITIPISLLSSILFFRLMSKAYRKYDEKDGELTTTLQENLNGLRVVRAFGREKVEIERFGKVLGEHKNLFNKVLKYNVYFWPMSAMLCLTQFAITVVVGTFLTMSGEITVGTFVLFIMYVEAIIYPIRDLGRMITDIGKVKVSISRINEVMDEILEQDNAKHTPDDLRGDIVFENCYFNFTDGGKMLKNINLTIESGKTTAILGSTGSGKSTLMLLLLRLFDYQSGSIKINDIELKDIKKSYIRNHVGIVLQDPFLYSKSIIENLRMIDESSLDEHLHYATKIAQIHHSIQDFENGFDTMIGEKGVTLSGGQKQRLAIARTLIKNHDILIFDDSLSAIDAATDAKIRRSLNERNKDTTTIIISQRISTIMGADKIVVMESGKIMAEGTHEELIKIEGLYKRIWDIQSELETQVQHV